MTYHADLSREEERFLEKVSKSETVQGKRDVISQRKPSPLEMRVKVVVHLHDGTTPEVDLLGDPEGPEALEDITSGVARLNRPLDQGSIEFSQATGLAELKPSDPRFKSVVSYLRYRLCNTDKYRDGSVADKIGTYCRRIRPFMKSFKFREEDLITILALLTKL